MREIVLFMVDTWAERAHLGSAPLHLNMFNVGFNASVESLL